MATAAPPSHASDPSRPLTALAARVQEALDGLPDAPRRALELRERDGLDHERVAAALEVSADDVADLLVAARMRVREAIRGAAAPPPESEDCLRARADLCRIVDAERPRDRDWTRVHVLECSSCTAARLAMREATLGARVWAGSPGPIAAAAQPAAEPEVEDALAPEPKAAEPPVIAPVRPAPVASRRPRPEPAPRRKAAAAKPVPAVAAKARAAQAPAAERTRVPRATALIAIAAVLISGGVTLALLTGGDSTPTAADRPSAPELVVPTVAPAKSSKPAKAKASKPAAKRKKRRPKRTTPLSATAAPAPTTTATPQATATPESERRQERRRTRRPAAQPDDDTGTDVGSGTGGLGQPSPEPGAGGTPGTQTPVGVDECAEDSPDCESG